MNLEAADQQAILQHMPAQDLRLQEMRPHEVHRYEQSMRSLRREWALYAVFCLAFLAGGFGLLSLAWGPDQGLRWLVLPALGAAYLLRLLWHNLGANQRRGEEQLLPGLGWGNRLTLLRGVLVAGMLGFWVLPRPVGWLAWIPGMLYVLANASDFFDGYLARITDHATRLGQLLDMSLDGLGVLAASVLAVVYGQAPAWYLLIGAARYLFLAGEWLRRRLGKTVYPVPPSFNRRVFAGLQMGFLAVALLPLIPPPGIKIAATLFGLPLLVGFGRDWLYASGALKSRPEHNAGMRTWISQWAPVGLRLLILAINVRYFAGWFSTLTAESAGFGLVGGLYGLAVGMLVLGVLPSVASIMALLGLGLAQLLAPLTPAQIGLGVLYVLILFNGSGALSLYNPEAYLYRNYAGKSRALESRPGR
jgi:CDP-diacylglycerol--glycerol-3-phosphate 3-phosphatidyltransferase